jgi:hypothetical protein
MNPEEKKPRRRRTSKQQPDIQEQQQEQQQELQPQPQPIILVDELQIKIQKLAVLKVKWNEYYQKNRERILKRKKELRERVKKKLSMKLLERRKENIEVENERK